MEIGPSTPFVIIGNINYGKPLLHRQLRYETPMRDALMVGFLAFDATKVSVNDVDYPLDIVLYEKNSFQINECRLDKEELTDTSIRWSELLKNAIGQLPDQWVDRVFDKVTLRKEDF